MFGKLLLILAATSIASVCAAPVNVEKRITHTGRVSDTDYPVAYHTDSKFRPLISKSVWVLVDGPMSTLTTLSPSIPLW
jgi:hypothetical protein